MQDHHEKIVVGEVHDMREFILFGDLSLSLYIHICIYIVCVCFYLNFNVFIQNFE